MGLAGPFCRSSALSPSLPVVACRDDRLPTRPGSPAERVTYNAVPDDPPEGTDALTWADISDPGNVLTNPPSVSGQVIWNTLYVYFNNGTTTPQKQALLDTLGADVIGGLPIGNPGAYHIRLTQAFPTAPDSSSGPGPVPVRRARTALARHRSARTARPRRPAAPPSAGP
jgi:hypothetical protein